MRFDRHWIVFAALLVLVTKVAAIPEYFNHFIKDVGCSLPDKGYDNHGDPVENEEITFSMSNSKGEPVTAWDAGEVYRVSTMQGGGIQFQALVLASLGTLNVTEVPEGENKRVVGRMMTDCEALWGSYTQGESQTVLWKAPAEVPAEGQCVEFSTAQAGSSRAKYQVNSMKICSTGSSDSQAAGGAETTGAATTEEAGEQTADADAKPTDELDGSGAAAEAGPRLQFRGSAGSRNSTRGVHWSTALALAVVSVAVVTIAVYKTKDGIRRAWYAHQNYVPGL